MNKDFEAWLMKDHGLDSEWQTERNCYKDFAAHLAFKSWQASRAALSNVEPVGYIHTLPDGSYFDCEDSETSQFLFEKKVADQELKGHGGKVDPVFLHPSVPASIVAWYSPATGGFYLSLDSVPPHIAVMGLQALGVIEELK